MTKVEAAISGFIAGLDDSDFDYFTNEEEEIIKCATYLAEEIKRFYDKNQVLVINEDPYTYEYDSYDLGVCHRGEMNRIGSIMRDHKPFGFDCVFCFDRINGVDNDIKIWNFILSLARRTEMF